MARFTLRMPTDMYDELSKQSKDQGVSMNTLILIKLSKPTKETRKKPKKPARER